MPKVSICIPTYNNLEAFKRCFESVLMQTYKDYEVVITDDSSNNDIEFYLKNRSLAENIFYYKNKTALGSPENWNEAMRKSTGEYIKILHHDDFFTYDYSLQTFVDLLDNNPETSLAFVASRNFDLEKNTVLSYNKPSNSKIEEIERNPITLINGNFIGAPSSTIFRNIGDYLFDKNTIWLVDIDFYIQLLKDHKKLSYNNIDAITIGLSPSQITKEVESDIKINTFEFFYLLEKWDINKIKNSIVENTCYSLLKKFNIYTKRKIRDLNFKGELPSDIDLFLFKILIGKISIILNHYSSKLFKST